MTDLETELCISWAARRRCQEHARQTTDDSAYYTIVLGQWRRYITRLIARIRAERATQ